MKIESLTFSFNPEYPLGTVKAPHRGTKGSAGRDIFVPELSERFIKEFRMKNDPTIYENGVIDSDHIIIPPHGRVVIPSGLHFNIPEGTYLEVANRGSVASKQGLIYGAHIIDSDYESDVFINLINTTQEAVRLEFGQKLVQLIWKEVIMDEFVQVEYSDLYKNKNSERGTGCLGSTNHK